MKKVLIIDDSEFIRELIIMALTETGVYEIIGEAADGKTGIELARKLNPDLITLDNILPDMIGIDIVKELRNENIDAKIIMVSSVENELIIEEGINMGVDDYLIKPFTKENIIERIDKLFD